MTEPKSKSELGKWDAFIAQYDDKLGMTAIKECTKYNNEMGRRRLLKQQGKPVPEEPKKPAKYDQVMRDFHKWRKTAELVSDLVKFADVLDSRGMTKEADMLDSILKKRLG